jgi:hypothetical protein
MLIDVGNAGNQSVSISSSSIAYATFIVEEKQAGAWDVFGIFHISTFKALKTLHLQVESDDGYEICPDDNVPSLTVHQWRYQYPTLESVQFVVTAWAKQNTELMKAVNAAQFLRYCVESNILTAEAHTSFSANYTLGDRPDLSWTSHGPVN